MTDDLDNLRPEVREAVEYMDRGGVARIAAGGWRIIRAELLRLAEDAAMFAHAVSLGQRYKQRAEHAEAELAEARKNETVALGLWNAAEDRATKAEAELAALKARIAESVHVDVTLGCAIDGEIPPDLALCKVALVKVEE